MKSLSDDDKTTQAIEIVLAGTDTSAFVLSTALFHLLSNSRCREKLVGALVDTLPDNGSIPALTEIEGIDYLVSG